MSIWQTIDTAPKDGTKIIIFKHGWDFAPVAKWASRDAEGVDETPVCFSGWEFDELVSLPGACEGGFIGWNEDVEDGCMPTHWAPFPPELSP